MLKVKESENGEESDLEVVLGLPLLEPSTAHYQLSNKFNLFLH